MKADLPPAARTTLAALAGAMVLASLGTSIATVALPNLALVFAAGVQQVQWVVLAYLLAVTVAIVVAGRMGDLYGNRRVLIGGVLLFTLAAAGCALAPSLGWLIAWRAVQGGGAAALMALPMSIAKSLIAKERLGAAMGLLGTMSAIGTALGPSAGGLLIGAFGWRAVFAVLVFGGIAVLVLAHRGVRHTTTRERPGARMDWTGSAWLSVALLGFALAATGARVGVALQPWVPLVFCAAALVMFIHTELTVANPLVPLALVRGRAIARSLWMNLLVGSSMMATLVVGPLFLSAGLGLNDAHTGLAMAVGPLVAALSGAPAGRLADRFGSERMLLVGLALAIAGLCGFAVLPRLIAVAGYGLAMALMTPGFQLFLAANNSAAMGLVAERDRGVLAGLLGLSRNLGFLTGAALLPLLFTALLDEQRLAMNSASTVSRAFSLTFLSVAGLCFLTLLLAMRRPVRAPLPPV